jgi:hypothetical protein
MRAVQRNFKADIVDRLPAAKFHPFSLGGPVKSLVQIAAAQDGLTNKLAGLPIDERISWEAEDDIRDTTFRLRPATTLQNQHLHKFKKTNNFSHTATKTGERNPIFGKHHKRPRMFCGFVRFHNHYVISSRAMGDAV